jgi:hypothetical protein
MVSEGCDDAVGWVTTYINIDDMDRAPSSSAELGVVEVAQGWKPAEPRLELVLASSEEDIGRAIVVDVLAVNRVGNHNNLLQSRGTGWVPPQYPGHCQGPVNLWSIAVQRVGEECNDEGKNRLV